MYLVSIFGFILVILITAFTTQFYPSDFIDLSGILLLLCICIPILLSTGLGKDFSNAFRIVLNSNKEYDRRSLRRTLEAVRLMIRTLLCSGGLLFLLNSIITLHRLDDPAALGPIVSTSFLSVLYALAISLLLLPMQSILKMKLLESEKENTDSVQPDGEMK